MRCLPVSKRGHGGVTNQNGFLQVEGGRPTGVPQSAARQVAAAVVPHTCLGSAAHPSRPATRNPLLFCKQPATTFPTSITNPMPSPALPCPVLAAGPAGLGMQRNAMAAMQLLSGAGENSLADDVASVSICDPVAVLVTMTGELA